MASDEELARQVARAEESGVQGSAEATAVREELAEYRAAAGEIHDELVRRIEAVDEGTPDEASLEAVVDRIERLERRIDDLEERL